MGAINLVTAPAGEPITVDEAKRHLRVSVNDDDDLIQSHLEAARERVELETGRQLLTATYELWLDSAPGYDPADGGMWGPGRSAGDPGIWMDWGLWWTRRAIDVPRAPLRWTSLAITGATHGTVTVDGIASTTGIVVGMVATSLSGADFAPGTTVTAIGTNAFTLSAAALTSATVAMTLATVGITYVDTTGTLKTWDPSLFQVHAPSGPTAERGKIRPAYGTTWPVTRDQMDAMIVRFAAGYGTAGASVPQMLRRAILMIAGDLYENREATVVTDRRVTVQDLPYGVNQILQQYRARPVTKAA